jgi:hypothetical protein
MRSGLENGEELSFGDDIIKADKDRFDFPSCGRSDRDFHFHGFDKRNVVAFDDAGPGLYDKRADAPRYLGHDLDVRHTVLQGSRRARFSMRACLRGGRPGLQLWPQIA